jgi:DNA-binding MarR family transcriptional regulator
MNETMIDRAASHMLTLVIFAHKQFLNTEHSMTGVKAAQYRLLGHLMKEGTLSMSALGNRLYISRPYMTNLVDLLLKEGYVMRKSDEKDRRVINISITESGLKHLKEVHSKYKCYVKDLLAGLNPGDLETLCVSTEKVDSILKKLENEIQSKGLNLKE